MALPLGVRYDERLPRLGTNNGVRLLLPTYRWPSVLFQLPKGVVHQVLCTFRMASEALQRHVRGLHGGVARSPSGMNEKWFPETKDMTVALVLSEITDVGSLKCVSVDCH